MDHKEQHHEHHRKEREHKIEEHRRRDEKEMEQPRTIHPGWFVALGIILIGAVILVWTFAQ